MLTFPESVAALRDGAVVGVTRRDVVVASGPDAAGYLHGQMSQNIEGLAVGASAWSLLLEPNGRVTAWARVTRAGDQEFWIDVDAGSGDAMLERLERFKLRTDAAFGIHTELPTAAVRGAQVPSAPGSRPALEEAASSANGPGVVVASLEWPKSNGFDVLGMAADRVAEVLGLPLADEAIVEVERIEAGRPAMGREFGEKTIPAETGVVERSADFTKGCYVGQELVARVDSRGNNTPRTVHPAVMTGSLAPAPGAELTVDGDIVGTVTSATSASDHVVALVSIKRGVEVPLTATVQIDQQPASVEVGEVDWV